MGRPSGGRDDWRGNPGDRPADSSTVDLAIGMLLDHLRDPDRFENLQPFFEESLVEHV